MVQKVNILPHERYDEAIKVLDSMAKMKNLSSQEKCNENHCIWPSYHMDLKELIKSETYQKLKIDRNSSTVMYQTRFSVAQNQATVQKDPIKQTQDNILILLTRLEKDLGAEVFDTSTIELIERNRFLTDC